MMTSRSKVRITLDQLKQSACAKLNHHLFAQPKKKTDKIGGKIVAAIYTTNSEEKDHMIIVLFAFCTKYNLRLYQEYRFVEDRGWRFDWCIPELKLAIEYEGLMSKKSGHTTVTGYSKDTEKYNRAALEGWTVSRYTALTYRTLYDHLTSFFIQHQSK